MNATRTAVAAVSILSVFSGAASAGEKKTKDSTQITITSAEPNDLYVTLAGDSKFTLNKPNDKKTAILGMHRIAVTPPKGFVYDRNVKVVPTDIEAKDLTPAGALTFVRTVAASILQDDVVPADRPIRKAIEDLKERKRIVAEQILNITRLHRALLAHDTIEKGLTGKPLNAGTQWVTDDKGKIKYEWKLEVHEGKLDEVKGRMAVLICQAELKVDVLALTKKLENDLFTTKITPNQVVAATVQPASANAEAPKKPSAQAGKEGDENTAVTASNSNPSAFSGAFAGVVAGPGVDVVTGLGFSKVGPASVTGVVISFDKKGHEAQPFDLRRRLGIIGGYSAGSRPMAFIGPAMRVADSAHVFGGLGFGSSGRESVTFGITVSLNGAIGKVTGNEEPKKENAAKDWEPVDVSLVVENEPPTPISTFISSNYSTVILVSQAGFGSEPGSPAGPVTGLKAGGKTVTIKGGVPWIEFGAPPKPRKIAVILFDNPHGEKLELINDNGTIPSSRIEATSLLGPASGEQLTLQAGKLEMIEIDKPAKRPESTPPIGTTNPSKPG
jgi:hypothetical protein